VTRDVDFDRALRTVSELRRLCLSLPHIATPAEQRLLARFDEIVASAASVTDADIPAITAGWRAWWRAQRFADIVTMAGRLPPDFVDADRELATYAVAAKSARG
jgi:hypothetical protein